VLVLQNQICKALRAKPYSLTRINIFLRIMHAHKLVPDSRYEVKFGFSFQSKV